MGEGMEIIEGEGGDIELEFADSKELVKGLYKDDMGRAFEMTPSQGEIFDIIYKKEAPGGLRRVHIETFTQFGKSEIIAMGLLTRLTVKMDKVVIVAPSVGKAKIIMGKLIKHVFENPIARSRLSLDEGEDLERLRRERSRSRLTFRLGNGGMSEIYVLSGESRLRDVEEIGNALMGFGGSYMVMDEAALVEDVAEAKAMRMIGGFTKSGDDFVVKVGNPFRRNHFLKSSMDADYYKVKVDYHKGIAEGRLTEKFMEEMKKKPYFDVLYGCKFPEADQVDSGNWSVLLTEEDIDRAMIKEGEAISHAGEKRIGNDVARGGQDLTVWVMRSMNYAEVMEKGHITNLMEVVGRTALFIKEYEVEAGNVFIDEIGVGGGAVDPLKMQNIKVRGINVGMEAVEKGRFMNLRAEAYWRLREWIKRGGRLKKSDDWYELTNIRYKPDSKGRLQIMSKDVMRGRGIDSPNCFVAGTGITVVNGRRNIEDIRVGDSVVTPYGIRRVIKTWEEDVDKIYTVNFSNGTVLRGKGEHKIFTERGFIRLDSLVINDIIETDNLFSLFLWRLKRLLFIKEGSIGFLRQADIIMQKGDVLVGRGQRLPCIVKYGWIGLVRGFLMDIQYIILTIIHIIIPQRILFVSRQGNICGSIWKKDSVVPYIEEKTRKYWTGYDRLLKNGTPAFKVLNGIKNMGRIHGMAEKKISRESVCTVKKNFVHTCNGHGFVQGNVIRIINFFQSIIIQIKEYAYTVRKNLWRIGIGLQNVVVESVRLDSDIQSTKVYNLTLDKDNVYYANGILANNCADALMLTFCRAELSVVTEVLREKRKRKRRKLLDWGKGVALRMGGY